MNRAKSTNDQSARPSPQSYRTRAWPLEDKSATKLEQNRESGRNKP